MAPPADRPLRFMQVVTFYPAYLRDFYAARPELRGAPYARHIEALLDDGFSGCHMLTRELAKLGWQCTTVVANAEPAQRAWLAEQEMIAAEPFNMHLTAALQIQMTLPDVVYFTDVIQFASPFIRRIPTRPKLVMGWRGFPIPPGTDLSAYDVIVTSFDRIKAEAPGFGARRVMHHEPAAPLDVEIAQDHVYDRDVIFSGSVTREHVVRVKLLETVWRASRGEDGGAPFGFELFMPDVSMFPPAMRALNRGSVWGNTMLRTLRRSRITLNIAVDGYDQPPNMRVIEATGAGAFLLTGAHPDNAKFFTPGREIETFADAAELIGKIRHYLAHEDERRAIAAAGRARCLAERNLPQAARRFHDKVTALLIAPPG